MLQYCIRYTLCSNSVTPECRVAESRLVGKPLTSINLLIGSNNAATRLKTINNILYTLFVAQKYTH